MSEGQEYGEQFETPIIVIMVFVMIAALVGVIQMNRKAHSSECKDSDMTYCGEHAAAAPEHPE